MYITFKNDNLEKLINSEHSLRKKFGKDCGRKIMRRMVVLRAATTLAEVPYKPPERCHPLKGDRKEQFAVWADKQFRIIFQPKHGSLPRKDDGDIDLEKVTAIEILEVEDYH